MNRLYGVKKYARHIAAPVLYLLNLFDMACTLHFFNLYGESIEANPIGLWLLRNPVALVIYKVGIIGIACILLYKHRENTFAWAATGALAIVYGALAIYHLLLLWIT